MPKVKVRVRNKKGEDRHFWRAGIQFTPEFKTYDLTPEQLKTVETEPMLEVEEAKPPTAKELIESFGKAETVKALEALWLEGEDREKVVNAYNKRLEELEGKK